jgi:hypothetical protein
MPEQLRWLLSALARTLEPIIPHPFSGMRYTRSAPLSRHATPALLGVYERQLYPFLETAARECESSAISTGENWTCSHP